MKKKRYLCSVNKIKYIMILNLTDLEIETMLTNEIQENGEYINDAGGWAMSTLETYYSMNPQYDNIVSDNFNRFAIIADRMW